VAPIAELARGEKSHTHSINHSLSLFEALGTEAFASENSSQFYLISYIWTARQIKQLVFHLLQ